MPRPDPNRLRRTTCSAAVFDANGRVLLHRRTDNGNWGLPGGAIEVGESAAIAVTREVKEETGIDTEIVRLIGIYSAPEFTTVRYPNGDVVSYVSILFECRVVGGSPTVCDESSAVDWFDPTQLPEPFLPNHRPRMSDALARQTAAFYR